MADNVTLNAGTGGDVVAADDIGGVKFQRVKVAFGNDGSASDASLTNPLPVQDVEETAVFRLTVPSAAVGANKVYFDLFNATGSGSTLRVRSVFAFVDSDTAVTGTLGVELNLTRTTAVGTGGTAATTEGTSLTAATFSKFDPDMANLSASITSRLGPTGGATAGAVLGRRWVFTEETNAASALGGLIGAEFIRVGGNDVLVPQNTGLRIVQGAIASVGSVGFEVNFSLQ
jgi:hypothetical protein